ncbi:hypothetical protein VWN94_10335, partial [Campylobacter coli]|uniref:hypothetical protein n=1 Tax=Campylobacter coli TaxID=195 RepID=UPI002E308FD3
HQYNLSIEGFSIVDGVNFHPLKLDYDDKNKAYSIYYETPDEKAKYLSQAMATQFYQNFKKRVAKMLDALPDSATYMAKRFEESF